MAWGYSYRTGERKDPGINSYMVGVAGISAMAAGNQIGADNCWRWMNEQDLTSGTIKHLQATLHVMYMAVMCGAFDCSVGDAPSAARFRVPQPGRVGLRSQGTSAYAVFSPNGRRLQLSAPGPNGIHHQSAHASFGVYVYAPDETSHLYGKGTRPFILRVSRQ